ncbi:MAG: tetratricopeptide repeat protein [Bacteroidetes bacterium]|nr:tetratricopeptide repeat protein [Bacteroidota bacterium]
MEAKQKHNYSKWRAISLSAVYVLMGIHIAHWKIAGSTLAPLELNEVLYTLHLGIITAGFLFMGVTLIATVVAGRFFCSWMCHILALQDASAWLLKKIGIRPKFIRSRTLLWIPVIVLIYLFVLPQVERIVQGQPAIHLRVAGDASGWASFVTTDFWRNLPGFWVTTFTFLFCGSFIIYFLGSRSFCLYGCPYGVLFALTDRVAPGRIKLTGDCNQCGICTASCQSHIQVHKEVNTFGMVVNPDCLKDLDCVQVCPTDALSYGMKKPAGFKSLSPSKNNKKHYDFSLAEDLLIVSCLLVFVFIFRGLYDTIPILLALGMALIFSWFAVVFARLFNREYVRLGHVLLKKSKHLTVAGRWFASIFILLVIFSAHSAFIDYHVYQGNNQYGKVLKQENEIPFSTSAETKDILEQALHHLSIADQWGLITPATINRKLAAIYIYRDEKVKAKDQLEKLLSQLPGDLEARLRFSKLLFVLNDESKCMENLQSIIAAKNVVTDHDKKIRSDASLMLGHMEEKNGYASDAESRYRIAQKDNPENHEATLALGVLLARSGKFREAETFLLESSKQYPNLALIENNLSVIYIRQHRYPEAIVHLDALIKIQPANQQAHYNRAMMLYGMGNKGEAMAAMQAAAQMNPGNANISDALKMMMDNKNTSAAKPKNQKPIAMH